MKKFLKTEPLKYQDIKGDMIGKNLIVILLNDLTYHIDAGKTLFLGTIILNDYELKDQIDHEDAYGCFNHGIVDGQQRFTTMTILFVALRESLKSRELVEVDQNLLKRISRTIEGIAGKFLALEDTTYAQIRPRLLGQLTSQRNY